jgi:hypothetical protein
LAAQRARPAGQHVSPLSVCLREGALRGERQRYIDQAAKLKRKVMRERTLFLIEYFKTHPCVDCGETDAVVLEFDHLRDKLFDVGRAVRDRGWQSLLNEMEKCEVVCANCHRRRTARRRGALRALLTVGPETD